MYGYIKALHIIFVVTWFAGLFYMPRLFIYYIEASDLAEPGRKILQAKFLIMMRRLWYGITWPSAVLTLLLGVSVLFNGGWYSVLLEPSGKWLLIKLCLVSLLYCYHLSLHYIVLLLSKDLNRYSSFQMRIWNEVATVFLIAIVMLATVKDTISWFWGLMGLFLFMAFLLIAINIYRRIRKI